MIFVGDVFGGRARCLDARPGLALDQIVAEVLAGGHLPGVTADRVQVYRGGDEVPAADWPNIVPVGDEHVLIVAAPGDPATIAEGISAIIAVIEGAVAEVSSSIAILASYIAPGLLTAAGVESAIWMTLGSLALGAASALLQGGRASSKTAYGISGASNTANPGGVCSVVLGRRRIVPLLAASTWTETVGDEVYLRMLVQWTCGPCMVSDIRIGETPIETFDNVEVQHRLLPADPFPSLYDRVVREDVFSSLELSQARGWVQKTTQRDTTLISIDFAWPGGLAWNGKDNATVQIQVQYRAVDSGTWLAAPVGTGGVLSYSMTKNEPFRRNVSWAVPSGQYDVRVLRLTADAGDDYPRLQDRVYWVCMRSFGAGRPVVGDEFALTAVRIQATKQLSGQIEDLNGIVQSLVPKWDAEAGAFGALGASSNPGELLHWIATGPPNAAPLDENQVDIAALGAFTELCTAKDWKCDTIVDGEMSVEQVARLVAQAGRALDIVWDDGRLSVAIDNARPAPVQLFSGRNVKNFSGTILFPDVVHAVDVSFYDAASDYEPATRTVYAEGYNSANASLIEHIDAPAKTDAVEAYVAGWRFLAARKLRPEIYEFDCDVAGLAVRIGDRADIAHRRMAVGITGARVKSLVMDGGNVAGFVIDETVAMEAGKSYVFRVQRGTSVGLFDVVTAPGPTSTLMLETPVAPASAPLPDNHGIFGEAGAETLAALIIGIATGEDKGSHVIAIPYAPDMQADGGTIPAWNPKIKSRSLSDPAAGGFVPPAVNRAVSDDVQGRLGGQQADIETLRQAAPEIGEVLAAMRDQYAAVASHVAQLGLLIASDINQIRTASAAERGVLRADYLERIGTMASQTAALAYQLTQLTAAVDGKVAASVFEDFEASVTDELASHAEAMTAVQTMFGEDYSSALLRLVAETPDPDYLAQAQLSLAASKNGAAAAGGALIRIKDVAGILRVFFDFVADQFRFIRQDTGEVLALLTSQGFLLGDRLLDDSISQHAHYVASTLASAGAFTVTPPAYIGCNRGSKYVTPAYFLDPAALSHSIDAAGFVYSNTGTTLYVEAGVEIAAGGAWNADKTVYTGGTWQIVDDARRRLEFSIAGPRYGKTSLALAKAASGYNACRGYFGVTCADNESAYVSNPVNIRVQSRYK